MSRSDYTYILKDDKLVIKDLNLGRMSVTNNIENIIKEIEHRERKCLCDYVINYFDSEGDLTIFDQNTGEFYNP